MTSTTAAIHDDRRLPALTGIRFLAALVVVVCHFAERGLIHVPAPFITFFDGGRTAVSLFFVLSGFVLTYNYRDLSSKRERRMFYVNRVARIYPVVLLALAIAAIGLLVAAFTTQNSYLAHAFGLRDHEPAWLAASLASQLTMTTGWFPLGEINQPWNNPAWSISCEAFFYAIFPLLIMRLHGRRPHAVRNLLVAAVALQIFVVAAALLLPVQQRGYIIYQFPLTHVLEFVVGMVAAIVFMNGGREWLGIRHRRALCLVLAVVPLVGLAALQHKAPAYLPMTPFFGLLILALAVSPTARPSWLSHRTLLLLGEASFSLYLIHIPIVNLLSLRAWPVEMGWVFAAATIGASVIVFKTYESPARRLTRRLLMPRASRRREVV